MADLLTTTSQLDPELVRAIQAEIAQYLQERYPEIDLSRGVLHDLVVYLSAVLEARGRTLIQQYLAARSLMEIAKDPAAADTDLADHVFSNYMLQRRAGTTASGLLAIVLSSTASTVLSPAVIFRGSGAQFHLAAAYTAVPPGSTPRDASEIAMQPRGDGTYKVAVPAVAITAGPTGNIPRGTRLVPDSPTSNFVMAYAETDFTGGVATETTAEVLARLQEGIAAKAWSNRTNIVAMIRSRQEFSDVLAVSIIGYGQPEMQRDRHGLFPVSAGGKTDIYVRTTLLPTESIVDVTATLVAKSAEDSIWQFSLDANVAPGFYEVAGVFPTTASDFTSGFAVVSDIRSHDLTLPGHVPDIETTMDSAYSRFQTAVIRFQDTEAPTADLVLGQTRTYRAVVRSMPRIAALQAYLGDPSVRNPAGDVLVRAPVPCWVTLNAEIQQAEGETPPDVEAMKSALAAAVNDLGFPGQLHASLLADVAHRFLSRRQAIKAFDLQGRIRAPNGEMLYVRGTSRLVIPDNPGIGVTGRTTCFFLDPRNISLTVVTEGFTQP